MTNRYRANEQIERARDRLELDGLARPRVTDNLWGTMRKATSNFKGLRRFDSRLLTGLKIKDE